MRWTNFKKGMFAALRVQLYVLCVGSVFAGVTLVRAYDKSQHYLGELGIGLLSGLGSLKAGVEQVELNGERFTFGAATTTEDPDTLVAEFETMCASSSGTLEQDLAPLIKEAKRRGAKVPDIAAARWTTMAERTDDLSAAQSGCFVRGQDKDEGSLWKRIEQFATTGTLGTLGGFRYLRADRVEDSEYTRVLAISSDAALDIDKMLPDEGDARGSDPSVTPRPLDSTRMFSARVLGSGQGAYVYTSAASREKLFAQYDDGMVQKGFERVSMSDGEGGEVAHARSYAVDDGAVVLSVEPDEEDPSKNTVIILEFGTLPRGEGK